MKSFQGDKHSSLSVLSVRSKEKSFETLSFGVRSKAFWWCHYFLHNDIQQIDIYHNSIKIFMFSLSKISISILKIERAMIMIVRITILNVLQCRYALHHYCDGSLDSELSNAECLYAEFCYHECHLTLLCRVS
jgi:hypothetical protein